MLNFRRRSRTVVRRLVVLLVEAAAVEAGLSDAEDPGVDMDMNEADLFVRVSTSFESGEEELFSSDDSAFFFSVLATEA